MKKIILSFTLLLIVHCTLNIEHCKCQWIYQSLPSYYEVKGIKFFDENTGIITIDVPHRGMLRTTNGGYNWVIIDTNILIFDIQKIDSVTIYAVGRNRSAIDRIQRTTNKGLTWDSITFPLDYSLKSLSFVNKDTGWVSGFNGNNYLIWRTTNGGVTLVPQTNNIGDGEIYFLRQKINGEYYGWQNHDIQLWRTTNSGNSWFQVSAPPAQYLFHIQFVDENTGWFSAGYNGIYKTTDGGQNWINQPLDPGIIPIANGMTDFICLNRDTLYGVGAYRCLISGPCIGVIWKTTNGGLNWGFQQPDTTYPNGAYAAIDFITSNTGWAFQGNGVHTTNGGGSIVFTGIHGHKFLMYNYQIFQNYPNPFNTSTKISFYLNERSIINLKIYDIEGKEILVLRNNEILTPGYYENIWNAINNSSGIYFYQLTINDNIVESKKMIYLK